MANNINITLKYCQLQTIEIMINFM